MFAHFCFSGLVWLKLVSFFQEKQYFYSSSNWIKYCLWPPPPLPPDPLFLFLLSPSLMDPQWDTPRASILHIGPRSLPLFPTPFRCLLPTPLVLNPFLLPPPSLPPHPSQPACSCPSRLQDVSRSLSFPPPLTFFFSCSPTWHFSRYQVLPLSFCHDFLIVFSSIFYTSLSRLPSSLFHSAYSA